MAFLTREQVKEIATEALHEVADFNGDIENYSFEHFHDYHKNVFAISLKKLLMESPYYFRDGGTSMERYYDIPLSTGIINSWSSLTDCINYVTANQAVRMRDAQKVQLS